MFVDVWTNKKDPRGPLFVSFLISIKPQQLFVIDVAVIINENFLSCYDIGEGIEVKRVIVEINLVSGVRFIGMVK